MTESPLLLPPGTRLIHIGPHKTGSTAIQNALFDVRERLPEHGAYYPAESPRRVEASDDLVHSFRSATPLAAPRWDALCEEVATSGAARVCVSDERFAKARPELCARIVAELGGPQPHIVAVARSYFSYFPSQWQERVKAGVSASYDEWLHAVLGTERSYERRNVWIGHDTVELVSRWAGLVGEDHFTLMVADDSDQGQLPGFFEMLLALPPGLLKPDPARSNVSLNFAEVEVIRQVNGVLEAAGWDRDHLRQLAKVSSRVIKRNPGLARGPRRPTLPEWAGARLDELSEVRADGLVEQRVSILGEVNVLRPASPGQGRPAGNERIEVAPELWRRLYGGLTTYSETEGLPSPAVPLKDGLKDLG